MGFPASMGKGGGDHEAKRPRGAEIDQADLPSTDFSGSCFTVYPIFCLKEDLSTFNEEEAPSSNASPKEGTEAGSHASWLEAAAFIFVTINVKQISRFSGRLLRGGEEGNLDQGQEPWARLLWCISWES